MLSFGFSAFLKLVSLNDRPQRTEIRKRQGPSSGGYDYHKSFRRQARRYLVEGKDLKGVLALVEDITRLSERLSAVAALERLEGWREAHPGDILPFGSAVYESPDRLFRVKFEPDFALHIGGKTVAIHLWNTAKPRLAPGPTYAAMTLAAQAYENQDVVPDTIGVLSIREPATLYLLSDVADQSALAASTVERLEDLIRGTTPEAPTERYPPV